MTSVNQEQSTATDKPTQRDTDFNILMRMSESGLPDEVPQLGLGIFFEPSGIAGIAQVSGFIRGLLLSDEETAKDAAHDFMEQLRYLASYGGMVDDSDGGGIDSKVPRYRVHLAHDCTFLGFRLIWRMARKEGATPERPIPESSTTLFSWLGGSGIPCASRYRPFGDDYTTWSYNQAFNGGLLYRGPAAGEVFSVHLGSPRFWSIHT